MQSTFSTNLPQMMAKAASKKPTPEQARSLAILQQGQFITVGPLPELALPQSCTIALMFMPVWEPWTESNQDILPPCLCQFGSAKTPGSILRISVNRELDGFRLERSGNTSSSITVATGGMTSFGILVVTFDKGSVTVLYSDKIKPVVESSQVFKLGGILGQPGIMQVGSDSASGKESPFAGIVGPVLVFDRPLSRAEIEKSNLLERLLFNGPVGGLLTAAESGPIASALVGIGWLGEKRFEVYRRDIIWPDPQNPDRWTLEFSDISIQLDVPNTDRTDHSIYSSTCIWCFIRRFGDLRLHGEAGQQFKLDYQASQGGKTIFQGTSIGTNALGAIDHISILTLSVEGDAVDISTSGWTNAERKLFPKMLVPQGASAPIDDAEHWPSSIRLVRAAPTYDTIVDPKHRAFVDQQQTYKDAFSKRIATIGASSLGWDASRLDNALNPLASRGASRPRQYYLFESPADDSKHYRLDDDIATPYYCFCSPINDRRGTRLSTMYSSASEFSQNTSISFGLTASEGKEKLFESSATLTSGHTDKSSEEHTVVVARHTTRRSAVSLDKRWLTLNETFAKALVSLAANPVRDKCFELFEDFGTHYPHSITYGSRKYSLGLIDATTMGTVVESGADMKAAIGIPVEEVTTGAHVGLQISTSTKVDTALESSMDLDEEIGSSEHPVPIMTDLRPVTQVMLPPYMCDDSVAKSLPTISGYLDEYLATHHPVAAPGYRLVQARLISIENTWTQPVDIMARAFLAAVDQQADWQIVLPSDRTGAESRIWASTTDKDSTTEQFTKGDSTSLLRIEPSATYKNGNWPSVFLSIPTTRTDLVPAIGWTGQTVFFKEDVYHDMLDTFDPPGQLFGDGVVPITLANVASASAMQAAEARDAGIVGFKFSGVDWADDGGFPEFYTNDNSEFVFKEKRKLPPAATTKFTRIVIAAGHVKTTFEFRVIDPTRYFDNSSAFPRAGAE